MNNMTQEKCYSCGGKGTYSQMHGIHGAEDFGADGFDLPPGIHNYPCKACDGTGLKKVMTQDWKEQIRSVSIKSDTTTTGLEVQFEPEVLIKLVESLLKEERNAVLEEVEREVEKKLEKWDESAEELEDGWGNYTVCLPWELKEKKVEISTIISNMKVI